MRASQADENGKVFVAKRICIPLHGKVLITVQRQGGSEKEDGVLWPSKKAVFKARNKRTEAPIMNDTEMILK